MILRLYEQFTLKIIFVDVLITILRGLRQTTEGRRGRSGGRGIQRLCKLRHVVLVATVAPCSQPFV